MIRNFFYFSNIYLCNMICKFYIIYLLLGVIVQVASSYALINVFRSLRCIKQIISRYVCKTNIDFHLIYKSYPTKLPLKKSKNVQNLEIVLNQPQSKNFQIIRFFLYVSTGFQGSESPVHYKTTIMNFVYNTSKCSEKSLNDLQNFIISYYYELCVFRFEKLISSKTYTAFSNKMSFNPF